MQASTRYRFIRLDLSDSVATLTLNCPDRLNALHVGVIDEILDALVWAVTSGQARAILLTGAGRGFCSGADLSSDEYVFDADDGGLELETHFNPLIKKIFALPVPIITAVNGPAVGAGCSLALCGDVVIAARSAYFLQSFARIGLVPDAGATWLLPRQIGRARALGMMMLAERIPAETAAEWGMIWDCVDDQRLMSAAHDLAMQLARGPTRAFALIRKGMRDCLETGLSEALAIERNHQRAAGETVDYAEGVRAFLERREPAYIGR